MAGTPTLRVPIQTPLHEVGQDDQARLTRTWIIFFEKLARLAAEGKGGIAGIGWDVQSSTVGTDVSDPVIPTAAVTIDSCQIRIKVTDSTNPLEIDIRQNGTSIFATHPTIAAGTTSRTVQVFRSFATSSLVINPKDDLVLDIVSGGTWQVAVYLVPLTSSSEVPPAAAPGTLTSPLTNKGDIWVYDTHDDRLGVGSNGQVLTADNTQPTGLKWTTPSASGSGTVTHTGGALTADLPVFGAGGADIKVGTKLGNTDSVAVTSGSFTPGHFLTVDTNGNVIDSGSVPLTSGATGTGTVTNSGGALTNNLPMLGAGGADSKVGTKSGTTNELATVTGTLVAGNFLTVDGFGNIIDGGSAPGAGTGGGTVTHTLGPLTADQPVFGASGADIKVGTKSGTTDKLATAAGIFTPGHFLTADSAGNIIDGGSAPGGGGGGSGTVTSVALTMPTEFSVSGSPVTTSGTLAVSKANQSPNTVYAGPTSGSAAPAFRPLVTADLPANGTVGVLGVTIDGAAFTPALGSKGFIQAPYGGTITGWTLIADQSGSAQITVKKATYAGFPATSSIVASAPPNLSASQKGTSTTLTGWTTTITAGDILEFNLDSVTSCTRLTLELQITKS